MNKILMVLFAVLNTTIFSQVTVTTSSCQVNPGNVTVAPCGTVSLGLNSSVNVNFTVNLSKPYNMVTGDNGVVKIIYRKSANGPDLYITQFAVPESFWSPSNNGTAVYTNTVNVSLNASNFNTSGGSFMAVFVSSTNLSYYSCAFPVVKDLAPSFSLSPSSITIPCGDASPRTFNVSASNIPAGANVTYNWYYSGWSGNATNTMSAVTLTPGSPNSLPSNVIVTPYINGVAQPSMACLVNRGAFTSSATIAGNPVVCIGSNDTYTLNGLGAGNTVTWSTSNTAIATVSAASGNQVTVNGISNGLVQLIATITNPCGQTVTQTKALNIGTPDVSNGIDARPLWLRKSFSHVLNCPAVLGATAYTWTIAIDNSSFSCTGNTTQAKFSANGTQTIVTTTPSVQMNSGTCITDYLVSCSATNSCGSELIYERYLTVGVSGSSPCNTSGGGLSTSFILQNPANKTGIVVKRRAVAESLISDREITYQPGIIANDGPCEGPYPAPTTTRGVTASVDLEEGQFEIRLYDLMGRLVTSGVIAFDADDTYLFQDANLKSGKYLVQISDNTTVFREIIIVQD